MKIVKEDSKIIFRGLNIQLKKGFEYPEDSEIVKEFGELFEEVTKSKKDKETILIDNTSEELKVTKSKRGRKKKVKSEEGLKDV